MICAGDAQAESFIQESLRRNNSPLGRAVYAEIFAHRSIPTNDPAASDEACRQIQAAVVFLEGSPLVNSVMAYAHYAAWRVGATVSEKQLQEVLNTTTEMGGYQLGCVFRAWCYEDLGDMESAMKECQRALKGTGSFDKDYAARPSKPR